MIEILTTGLMNSAQDLGRPGFLDQGIARGGVMDRTALEVANLLVGNEAGAAALEISIFPFRLRFHAPILFSVTGAGLRVTLNDRPMPPWWACSAETGDELRLDPPETGARAVIAFSGGLDLPIVLGSRATDLKSGFGGLEGRSLQRGDRLAVLESQATSSGHGADPLYFRDSLGASGRSEPLTLRVMQGAEFDRFTDQARQDFLSTPYLVSAENNRQGMRLEGPALSLTQKLELLSHGIMPGTVQVPPSGQPVIQLAEANTCGGYPKFAHVIEPDLWKLAQAPSGAKLRFAMVTRDEAVAAIRQEQAALRRLQVLRPLVLNKALQG